MPYPQPEIEHAITGQLAPYKNQKLLLACSGGVDSVVLAAILHRQKFDFALAHCNFQLRGAESDEDQNFVLELAAQMGVPVHSRNFSTGQRAQKEGKSIQQMARELRYEYFEELREKEGYPYLVTAHHLDDSLETVLINMSRGTGLRGLTGIRNQEGVLRPMQWLSKDSILRFALQEDLNWREDRSNAIDDYFRNAIRNQVVLHWREAYPNLESGIRRTLQHLGDDQQALDHLLQKELDKHLTTKGKRQDLQCEALYSKPHFTALLHYWLAPLGFPDLSSIAQSLQKQSGQQYQGEGYRLLHHGSTLVLEESPGTTLQEYRITKDQTQVEGSAALRIKWLGPDEVEFSRNTARAFLDGDKLVFPLKLRRWRHGDSFVPLGMQGRKKISDLLIDRKIDRFAKENIWVLESDGEIAWVVGIQPDERFKVRKSTKNIYFVELLERANEHYE